MAVFHIIPHAIPHTRNKDSHSDSMRTLPHFLVPLRTPRKAHFAPWLSGLTNVGDEPVKPSTGRDEALAQC